MISTPEPRLEGLLNLAARPEPEWLTQLRTSMRDGLSDPIQENLGPCLTATRELIADIATGTAASYIHPLYRVISDLEVDVKNAEDATEVIADVLEQSDGIRTALKAQVGRRESTIAEYERELASTRTRVAALEVENAARLAELEGYDDQYKAGRWMPLTEVTDGHVRAFWRAYNEGIVGGTLLNSDRIRAGLAAIQWPAREIRGGAEMREVPVIEVREGDTVTVSFTAHAERLPDGGGLWLSEFEGGFAPSMFLAQDAVTVTRPVTPLPDKPGAVIRCIAMRGTEVADAREVVAQLQAKIWRGTDGYAYLPSEVVRVLNVLDNGRSAD